MYCPQCGASNFEPINRCRVCRTDLKPIGAAITGIETAEDAQPSPAKYVTAPITTEMLSSRHADSPPDVAPTIVDPTIPMTTDATSTAPTLLMPAQEGAQQDSPQVILLRELLVAFKRDVARATRRNHPALLDSMRYTASEAYERAHDEGALALLDSSARTQLARAFEKTGEFNHWALRAQRQTERERLEPTVDIALGQLASEALKIATQVVEMLEPAIEEIRKAGSSE